MNKWFKVHTIQFGLAGMALGVVLLLSVLILSKPSTVAAAPQSQSTTPSNESCLFCHKEQGLTAEIGGQPLP